MDIMSKVASLCEEHQIRLAEKHELIQEGA